jgi:hypothetical protein
MCRNITALRGLEPPATAEEISAAALQYVRKVGGLSSISPVTRDAVDRAVAEIAATTTRLLAELPERRVPPLKEPPLRRLHRRDDDHHPHDGHDHDHGHDDHDHGHDHDHDHHDHEVVAVRL